MAETNGALPRYDFGRAFQRDVLALAVRDPSFLVEVGDALKDHYFEDDASVIVAKMVFRHYDKYRERPSKNTLSREVRSHAKKHELDPDFSQELSKEARRLFTRELPTDPTYVKDQVAHFGRIQATKEAMLEAVDDLDAANGSARFDQIIPRLQKAVSVGTGNSMGIQVFDDPARPSRFREESDDPRLRVPTGYSRLDKIMRGGAGAGRLHVVLGESGIGKSMFLVNIASFPASVGRPTVYITTEMPEYDVMVRLLARMTGRSIEEVEAESPSFKKLARKIKALGDIDKYLRIVRVKPNSPVTQVRSVISRLEANDGVRPAVIVVDYADELAPSASPGGVAFGDNSYIAYGNVYSELISLGVDWQCPVWTASQIQRAFYSAENPPGMESVSDSLKKAQMAHLVVSLFRTQAEEVDKDKMSMHIAKHRGGRSNITIGMTTDLSKCLIQQRMPTSEDEEDV